MNADVVFLLKEKVEEEVDENFFCLVKVAFGVLVYFGLAHV